MITIACNNPYIYFLRNISVGQHTVFLFVAVCLIIAISTVAVGTDTDTGLIEPCSSPTPVPGPANKTSASQDFTNYIENLCYVLKSGDGCDHINRDRDPVGSTSSELPLQVPTEFIGFAVDDPEYRYDTELVHDKKGRLVEATGLGVSLYHDLAFLLKFKPTIKRGTGWGQLLPNETWTGIPSQMLDPQHDELDNVLCISSTTLIMDRASEFTFLQPSYSNYYFVHFSLPPARSFSNVFLQPFHSGVWISIFFVSVLAGFFLKCTNCFGCNKEMKADDRSHHTSFSDLILWIFSNICQKGWSVSVQPRSNSMRITFLSFILTTTVLYAAYSAVLVSLLSLDEKLILNNLSQLTFRNIRIYEDQNVPFIFRNIEDSPMTAINSQNSSHNKSDSKSNPSFNSWPKSKSPKNVMNLKDAVGKVLSSRSAIVTLEGFYTEFRRQNHSLEGYCGNITTIRVQKRQAGMYVRKGWKYKGIFAIAVVKILERGLNFRYNRIASKLGNPKCGPLQLYSKRVLEQIQLDDVITAFILLGAGFGISLAFLCLEYLMHSLKQMTSCGMVKYLSP